MPDDKESPAKGSASAANQAAQASVAQTTEFEPGLEHYEEVAEYRIGEGPPPLALVVMFILIVLWATLSWVPFFGY